MVYLKLSNAVTHPFKFLDVLFGQCPVNIKPISWVQHNSFHLTIFKKNKNIYKAAVSKMERCQAGFKKDGRIFYSEEVPEIFCILTHGSTVQYRPSHHSTVQYSI